MEIGINYKKKFNETRTIIFTEVAEEVCSQWVAKIQPLIGVWKSNVDISFDKNKTFSISETGVLSFSINIGSQETITCSIFMFFGEIRIGIVFHNQTSFSVVVNQSEDIVKNNQPLFKEVGNAYMIDWVFRDEWVADMKVMQDMMSQPNLIGAVADAISKQTIHIIVSTVVTIPRHKLIKSSNAE